MNASASSKLDRVVAAARRAESPPQRAVRRMADRYAAAVLPSGYATSSRVERTADEHGRTTATEHWDGRRDVRHSPHTIRIKVATEFGPRMRARLEEALCDLFGDRARVPAYLREG